nr:hypothetical protein Iba_chr05fCG5290 [Ipomoea batatas]
MSTRTTLHEIDTGNMHREQGVPENRTAGTEIQLRDSDLPPSNQIAPEKQRLSSQSYFNLQLPDCHIPTTPNPNGEPSHSQYPFRGPGKTGSPTDGEPSQSPRQSPPSTGTMWMREASEAGHSPSHDILFKYFDVQRDNRIPRSLNQWMLSVYSQPKIANRDDMEEIDIAHLAL